MVLVQDLAVIADNAGDADKSIELSNRAIKIREKVRVVDKGIGSGTHGPLHFSLFRLLEAIILTLQQVWRLLVPHTKLKERYDVERAHQIPCARNSVISNSRMCVAERQS
jgi:hypothetical protein